MLIAVIALTVACLQVTVPSAVASQSKSDQNSVEIPVCSKSFGTLAVVDHREGGQWWLELNLSPPSVLITDYVRISGCFNLVDRSTAFNFSEEERQLFASGMLRPDSNVGLGQIIAADYFMVAALVGQNKDEHGIGVQPVRDLLCDIIPSNKVCNNPLSRLPGSIDTNKKTADVVLQIVDARSSAIVATMQGHGTKRDVGFRILGNGDSGGIGIYSKTDMGKVIAKAYLDAYINISEQFRSLPKSARESNPVQAMEVIRPARLLANPRDTNQAVRSLDVGMLLYPTGNRHILKNRHG